MGYKTKDELLEEARTAELDVDPEMTREEIKEALDDHEPIRAGDLERPSESEDVPEVCAAHGNPAVYVDDAYGGANVVAFCAVCLPDAYKDRV